MVEYDGQQRRLQVFVFWAGSELAGIVPMFVDCSRLTLVQFRIAKLIGSDFCQKLADPAIRDPWAEPTIEWILNHFLGNRKCDAVWFGPLSDLYRTARTLRQICARSASTLNVARRRSDLIQYHALSP